MIVDSINLLNFRIPVQGLSNDKIFVSNNICLTMPKDRVEISFKGDFSKPENIAPINIEQLKDINGVHCPACGTRMFSQEAFDELINKAQNFTSASELAEMLNEYKEYITPNYKRVIYMTNNIGNIDNLTIPSYIGALKQQAFDEKQSAFDYLKSYLNYYSEHFEGEQKQIILEAANNLDPCDNYFNNGKIIMNLCSKLNLDKNQSNELRRNTMQNLFLACRFLGGLDKVYPIDCEKSDNELAVDFVKQIFKHSLLKENTIVQKSNNKNNVLIMCSECQKRQSQYAFWHSTSNTGLKNNIQKYLKDVSQLMGEKKIDNSQSYISDFCYMTDKVSKQKISFSESEIKYIKVAQNVLLRHDYFAPVRQSEVEVPCAECGTTMLPYEVKVKIAKELKQCETPYDFVEMLEKYDKYINPVARDISACLKKAYEYNPDASNEEILAIFRRAATKKMRRQVQPIINRYISKRHFYIPEDENINSDTHKIYSYSSENEKLRRFDLIANRIQDYVNAGKFNDFNINKLQSGCFGDIDLSYPKISAAYSLFRSLDILAYKATVLSSPNFIEHNPKAELAETLYELFNMDAATADHLIAAKKGGAKTPDNMIGLCRSCNYLKGSKSVNTWYTYHPDVRKNFYNHVKVVDNMSKDGIIKGYEDWARQIAEKMYKETNKRFDIRNELIE